MIFIDGVDERETMKLRFGHMKDRSTMEVKFINAEGSNWHV